MSTLTLGQRNRYSPKFDILEGRLAPATIGPAPALAQNVATPGFVGPVANPSPNQQGNPSTVPTGTQTGTPAQPGQQTTPVTPQQPGNAGLTAFPTLPPNTFVTPNPALNPQLFLNTPPIVPLVPLPNQLYNVNNVSLTDITSANVARLAASGASVPARTRQPFSNTTEQEGLDFQELRVPLDYVSAVLEMSGPDQIVPASALMHLHDATQGEPASQRPDEDVLDTDADTAALVAQIFAAPAPILNDTAASAIFT